MTQPRSPKDTLDEDEFPKDTESVSTTSEPSQTPGPQDEREWAQRRILLQAVLRYLTARGPTHWATLYLHFDSDGTGEIGPALGHLAVCKHIQVEGTTAKITALRTEQLLP
jgi:hypothetical protein